jgi:hypothetical protein
MLEVLSLGEQHLIGVFLKVTGYISYYDKDPIYKHKESTV